MSNTLINSVKSAFTNVLISKFSVLLNETEGNIQKTVQAAIPIVLTEVLHQAGSSEGAVKIWNLSKQAAGNDFFGQLHELSVSSAGLVAGSVLLNKGADFAKGLLTDHTDFVIKEISRHAGISIPSASFITGVVSFASLDSIGRQMTSSNMDVKGLTRWLDTQRESIIHAIPPGLQVKAPLGIHLYPREKAVRARRKTVFSVALGLIAIFVVILLVYRSSKQTNLTGPTNTEDSLVTAPTTVASLPVAGLPDTVHSTTIRVTLPNGNVLDAYKGGTEDQLVNFLSNPYAKLHKKNGDWFNFTKIGFASSSASLLLESEKQLKNIVAILAAFPKTKIKIGGYSDNTGDSTDNVRLSQQRADNILAKLKDLDAKPSQLTGAKGYGPNYPVGDNGTAAGRNMNRRMSIDVKAK